MDGNWEVEGALTCLNDLRLKEPSGGGGGGGSGCCPGVIEEDDVSEGSNCEGEGEGRTFGPGWEGFDFVRTRAQEKRPPEGLVVDDFARVNIAGK